MVRDGKSSARLLDENEVRFDEMIETAANGLLDLRSNPAFKTLVHDQIALQFDGDDNVLLKTLDSVCAANEINLEQEMENSLTNVGREDLIPFVHDAIHGFEYFEDTLYLQVFVPNVALISTQQTPIIVENHTTEELGIHKGFEAGGTPMNVDPGTVEYQLCWVVSANESVGNNARILPRILGSGSWPTPGPGPAQKLYNIVEIEIYDKKDDVFNGKCELMFTQYRHNWGCNAVSAQRMIYVGKYASATYQLQFNEAMFADVNSKWNNSAYISTTWFERDVRKAFERTEDVVPGCSNMRTTYRSQESAYGTQQDVNPWTTIDPNFTMYSYDNGGLTDLALKKHMY